MVAKRHKITNVPLFKKTRDNLRGQKSLGPLKMSLETAQKVIVPHKKIMSSIFLNSGTLIVIMLQVQIFPVTNVFCLCCPYGEHTGGILHMP